MVHKVKYFWKLKQVRLLYYKKKEWINPLYILLWLKS